MLLHSDQVLSPLDKAIFTWKTNKLSKEETPGDKLTEMMLLLTVLSTEITSDMVLYKEIPTLMLEMDKLQVSVTWEVFKWNQD